MTDSVYVQSGIDREAIRASIRKMNIKEDPEFSEIIERMENFHNTSFLN